MFDNGFNTVEIEKAIGKDNSSIGLFLKKNGRQPRCVRKYFTEQQKSTMCEMYRAGKSTEAIGEVFGITGNTVSTHLKSLGVSMRAGGTQPKIKTNNYFEVIDTEKKAYFLGLIIADGSIIEPHTRIRNLAVSITLHKNDSYLLSLFSKEVCNGESHVIVSKNRTTSEFRGASKQMCDDLSKYGVTPRKTFKTYLPTIDEELMPHLIRGIFDGDGTVYTYANQKNCLRFGFYGTNRLLNDIKKYLIAKINISDNKVHDKKQNNVSMIYFGKKADILNFYHLIYDEATVFMRRKREKFESMDMLTPR